MANDGKRMETDYDFEIFGNSLVVTWSSLWNAS